MQGREEVSPVPCLVGNAREAKQVWRNVAHPALQNKQAGPLKCPSLPAGEVHPLLLGSDKWGRPGAERIAGRHLRIPQMPYLLVCTVFFYSNTDFKHKHGLLDTHTHTHTHPVKKIKLL